MLMIMGDVLIRGGNILVEENNGVLVAKIDATAKLSADKLEKLASVLANNGQTTDAGLAHIAALYEYNPNKKIELVQDNSYVVLSME